MAGYADEPPDKSARAIAHHIQALREEIARELWSRGVFVGVTVIDELLFQSARAGAKDPVKGALEQLRDWRYDSNSLIVLPLHSFGVLAAGLLRPFRSESYVTVNSRQRYALTPQTNKFDRTVEFIDKVGPQLGVKKSVDPDLLKHWHRSRGADWLEHNPLLISGVRSITGYYYENEFLHLGRLQVITASIVMLCALQPTNEDAAASIFSSSNTNNWETRDIRHYLLLHDQTGKYLGGRAVPIHKRRQVDELSDLSVDLDPRHWNRRPVVANRIFSAMQQLHAGYLEHSIGVKNEDARGLTYRKLFDAVYYYRRSFRDDWTSSISLATAFEMLLTDRYERGVTERLRRRTALLLKGVRGTRGFQQSVVEVYEARSATVHRGVAASQDHANARVAFVLCFLSLMAKVPKLSATQVDPMTFLTGD